MDRRKSPASPLQNEPSQDLVEQLLEQQLADAGVIAPLERLGGGYYAVGRKQFLARMHEGRLMVKTEQGYMEADDFIDNFIVPNRTQRSPSSPLLDRSGGREGTNSLNRSGVSQGGGVTG